MNLLKRLFTPQVVIGLVILLGLVWAVSVVRAPSDDASGPPPAAQLDNETPRAVSATDVPPAAPPAVPEPIAAVSPQPAAPFVLPVITDIMTTDFLTLWQEASAGTVLQLLRQRQIDPESAKELYVVDRVGRLQGTITARQLLIAPPTAPLKEFMQPNSSAIQVDASQTDVARLFGQPGVSNVLPVVDKDRKVIGVVETEHFFKRLVTAQVETAAPRAAPALHQGQPQGQDQVQVQPQTAAPVSPRPAASRSRPAAKTEAPSQAVLTAPAPAPAPTPTTINGPVFIDSMIAPLDYELNKRFWGWRPNDLIQFTDNVNNFQLGVLETTRRASIILAESISRTGNVESFDPNVERAMNWFMFKADKYWLPSAESKFRDGLKELENYKRRLEAGQARFYNRSDNLLPLLRTFVNLLGSADDMLTRVYEEDGSKVSIFKVDDYFYYSQGIASAMLSILQGAKTDFQQPLRARAAENILMVVLNNLERAVAIKPWIILDSDYSSLSANHRANLVAPISNARFYLDILIETLST